MNYSIFSVFVVKFYGFCLSIAYIACRCPSLHRESIDSDREGLGHLLENQVDTVVTCLCRDPLTVLCQTSLKEQSKDKEIQPSTNLPPLFEEELTLTV